jgi:hypothetical protein
MNNNDERDYAEEEYNRNTARREHPLEFVIQGNYGESAGWEDLTIEETPEAADDMLETYRRNEPQYRHRIDVRDPSEI